MPKKHVLKDRGVVRVTFELPADVQGESVHLVGDFTSWKGIPMEKRDDGKWQTTVDLEPGKSFEFRYLIDGSRWENDWAADRYLRNEYGNENSVIETPSLQAGQDGDRDGIQASAMKPTAEKAVPKVAAKAAAPKKAAKQAPPKRAAAKKAAAKKTATNEPAAKKAAAKKAPAKKAPAKKTGRKPDADPNAD
jgi:hypothetical protein